MSQIKIYFIKNYFGLMSRQVGLFSKLSLWSLSEMNASRFFVCSVLSPILSLLARTFNSLSIAEMVSADPCLYVFVMLSCSSQF